jgi:hypothetical protein
LSAGVTTAWLYYVKAHGAGRQALIAEWIAGNLGKRLGLPIPDFKQAVMRKKSFQPQRGCIAVARRFDATPLGLMDISMRVPGVAAARQRRADRWNPFRILPIPAASAAAPAS